MMMVCEPDSVSSMLNYWIDDEALFFFDLDNSGTISSGDVIAFEYSFISQLDESMQLRLYSIEAENHCDQNPLMNQG